MSEQDTAKRAPTPDEIKGLIDLIRRSLPRVSRFDHDLLTTAQSALEAQRDQLQQAREIIDDLNHLQHLSSTKGIVARLDPILEKAAAFKRANPAPAATKEHHGK